MSSGKNRDILPLFWLKNNTLLSINGHFNNFSTMNKLLNILELIPVNG